MLRQGHRVVWWNYGHKFLLPTMSRTCRCVSEQIKQPRVLYGFGVRHRSSGNDSDFSSLVKALPLKPIQDPDGINVGEELTGRLNEKDIIKTLNKFYTQKQVKELAADNGLDDKLFHQAFVSFRRFCVESKALPVDVHILLNDIIHEARHITDLLPYFLKYAKMIFPHLECMEDLQKISDLRLPANWYPEARSIHRKIIYHAGPTNSGKTYHALQRYSAAKSGVYCGPLRLLANEVFHRTNVGKTPCDLITGEERRYVREDGEPADHVSCTVEMLNVTKPYEVAVIDEIQMLRDPGRGWAWTRALLGACAQEVHVCGEASAIDIVKDIAMEIGDELEVRKYKRLTPIEVLDKAVEDFSNIRPGDCIVCFSKNDIYHCSRQLEKRGVEAAVIYGTLPPGTKVAQANKFNDADDPCRVMVSTDAIGMGLNLNIKRIIFYSLVKPTINEKGEKEIDFIPISMTKQIAGRAGRYGTQYEDGEVTTFKTNDLSMLQQLLASDVEPVKQAGLHPTADQIELFAYHLPNATLSNLIDIFVTLSQLDSDRYFLCKVDDFKFLADMIEHIPVQLRVRYVFCCAPIAQNRPFVCAMFLRFARQYSRGEPMTFDWLCRQINWPFQVPTVIKDQIHLESVFDVLDLYLWLSYRFMDMFPDADQVRHIQKELDGIIQEGVANITKLLRNTESHVSTETNDEDDFEVSRRRATAASSIAMDFEASMKQAAGDSPHPTDRKNNRKLTEQLIESGVITPAMIDTIIKEHSSSTKTKRSGRLRVPTVKRKR
ncbi:hypothetical protein LSH36_701g02017 [Paralvinella palmiformis]|uniref:RNA helicase n=1 Tax=Paralvinella palmiformis TaxID=53620 RepID=A0AAD9J2X7_9ANNE|nr:hypothetical protein LSH36_701g02017 [Paralvinella palmiformis]